MQIAKFEKITLLDSIVPWRKFSSDCLHLLYYFSFLRVKLMSLVQYTKTFFRGDKILTDSDPKNTI